MKNVETEPKKEIHLKFNTFFFQSLRNLTHLLRSNPQIQHRKEIKE